MSSYRRTLAAGSFIFVAFSSAAYGQQVSVETFASISDGMLVTSKDVPNCPYEFVGPVSINMRATWIGRNELAEQRIADKLRKAARKMKADAVVLVTIGQSHFTVMSVRATPVTGRAIRFVDRSCAPTA